MQFDLTADQKRIQEMVEDFAQREVAPRAEALDCDAKFLYALFAQLGSPGFTRFPLPRNAAA
jgi:alkylation response protein AidB-like acyl-CoA dehydrogenase